MERDAHLQDVAEIQEHVWERLVKEANQEPGEEKVATHD